MDGESPGERRLFDRLRGAISLSRAQAIAGLVAVERIFKK